MEDNALSLSSVADSPAKSGSEMELTPQDVTSEKLLAAILKSLDDDKAEDVVQIELRGKSEMGDYMVIASGRSSRHVVGLSNQISEELSKNGSKNLPKTVQKVGQKVGHYIRWPRFSSNPHSAPAPSPFNFFLFKNKNPKISKTVMS